MLLHSAAFVQSGGTDEPPDAAGLTLLHLELLDRPRPTPVDPLLASSTLALPLQGSRSRDRLTTRCGWIHLVSLSIDFTLLQT